MENKNKVAPKTCTVAPGDRVVITYDLETVLAYGKVEYISGSYMGVREGNRLDEWPTWSVYRIEDATAKRLLGL